MKNGRPLNDPCQIVRINALHGMWQSRINFKCFTTKCDVPLT